MELSLLGVVDTFDGRLVTAKPSVRKRATRPIVVTLTPVRSWILR